MELFLVLETIRFVRTQKTKKLIDQFSNWRIHPKYRTMCEWPFYNRHQNQYLPTTCKMCARISSTKQHLVIYGPNKWHKWTKRSSKLVHRRRARKSVSEIFQKKHQLDRVKGTCINYHFTPQSVWTSQSVEVRRWRAHLWVSVLVYTHGHQDDPSNQPLVVCQYLDRCQYVNWGEE